MHSGIVKQIALVIADNIDPQLIPLAQSLRTFVSEPSHDNSITALQKKAQEFLDLIPHRHFLPRAYFIRLLISLVPVQERYHLFLQVIKHRILSNAHFSKSICISDMLRYFLGHPDINKEIIIPTPQSIFDNVADFLITMKDLQAEHIVNFCYIFETMLLEQGSKFWGVSLFQTSTVKIESLTKKMRQISDCNVIRINQLITSISRHHDNRISDTTTFSLWMTLPDDYPDQGSICDLLTSFEPTPGMAASDTSIDSTVSFTQRCRSISPDLSQQRVATPLGIPRARSPLSIESLTYYQSLRHIKTPEPHCANAIAIPTLARTC